MIAYPIKVNRNQGIGLIELMIAMVLGLLITAAVVQFFLTNRQTFNLQQGVASVQEQGRFAVDFLSREMMTAGYGDVAQPFAFSHNAIEGLSADRSHSQDGDLFDVIVLFLEDGTDCAGGKINETTSGDTITTDVTWKRISVTEEDDSGILQCNDSDGNSNVLIDNVEAFQVLYGVSSDPEGTVAERYAAASDIEASDKVVSVRYGVLVASNSVAVQEREHIEMPAYLLDLALDTDNDESIDFKDGRLRRVFISTVALRNLAGE